MLTEKRIGPYKLTREAGRGEASTVYEAVDTRIGRTVAVKVQNAPQNLPPEQWEAMKRRMEREARAIGRVSHPNVAKVYVVGTHGRLNYLVMEFLDGVSLQERLDTGPLSPAESAHILSQVAAGLEAVHAQGVVHRDIKPSNIMIMADSTVKLTDFGVAHAADDPSLTSHGVMVGSPSYMSPEQAQGEPATAGSDVWALGVLLYHMLAGKMPFTAETVPSVLYKIVHEDPEFPASLSEETSAVLRKALDKNVENRFASAGALAAAFQASLHDPTVIVQKPALPPVVHTVPQPVFGIPARVRNAFSPRVPLPATAYKTQESRPVWQTAAAGAAAFALFALGGTALWLSQRPQSAATRLPSLASSDDSTSVSASLPESRRPGVPPSSTPSTNTPPPGPASSGNSRTGTITVNKPRQVASATTGKPRVQILASKVTPKVPVALPDRPISPKGLDGWQLGELLPPAAGAPPQEVPKPTPTPPSIPTPTPRPTPVEEPVRKPAPPVETPRPR
jgi:serine/threonine-protein kinase